MSRSAAPCLALAAVSLLVADIAKADDPDASALMLADQAPSLAAQAGDWRIFTEGAVGGSIRRNDGSTRDSRRLSLDIQYDHSFSADWRTVFADRLDMSRPTPASGQSTINTLKEVYVSWWAQPETLLDMGRINVRNGVAMGYNPTDYFRRGALRSIVSINPASLKENRQGSFMLRGQRLWESGSATVLYSPKLNRGPNPYGLSPDVGATNDSNRWLVAVSQKIGATATPQFLAYGEEEQPIQFGFNLTGLVNDATVAHFEWSGGRSPSLLGQALQQAPSAHAGKAWRNRLATGLTYTTPGKISLTAEYHYNGGGLDDDAWNALRQGPLAAYGQYRNWVRPLQELPTKRAAFFYATWQDALINRLDLSVMHNLDLTDSSHRLWLEVRYHAEQFEYALQWQRDGGRYLSNFGAMPDSRGWQAVMRYFF